VVCVDAPLFGDTLHTRDFSSPRGALGESKLGEN